MLSKDQVDALFASIDAMDAEAFASVFTDGGRFVYGAQMDVEGRSAVIQAVAGFFGTLRSLSHSNIRTWAADDGSVQFVAGDVHYVLPNGNTADVAFLNLLRFEEGRVSDYRVFTDPTPLFAAAAP